MPADTEFEHLRSSFFDCAQESFMILDKDLNLIDANENFLRSMRLKLDQIRGKSMLELSPGLEKTERYRHYIEVLKTGKPVTIDEVRPHPSLGKHHARVVAFRIGKDCLGISALDITALTEAIDELETFIYKSSHDLRSPIASIMGLTDLAISQTGDQQSLEYFTQVKDQILKLDILLKELIQTTRIRHGDRIIHPIDFLELIGSTKLALEYLTDFNKVLIDEMISVKEIFYSDKNLVSSIFQNLIDNAIKYRRKNINSWLKIAVCEENGGVKITFSDNGIGIPDHLQKDIFKMFFRATNQASGSGLGLYTVKHCVKKLGGTIAFESKLNSGTCFQVYLPNLKN